MRALALGQQDQQPPQSSDYCVAMIQSLLVNQGRLSVADRTGYMNQNTANALNYAYGQGWENFPGGLCALATAGGVFGPPPRPYGYGGYYPPINTTQTSLYLIVGGAALVALLLAMK